MPRPVALFIAFFLLALAALPFCSVADTVTSTDFAVKDAFVGSFGGYASSTDFQVVTGGSPIMNNDSTSTNFSSHSGPVNSGDFSPASQNWRWYSDSSNETPISPLASQNIAPIGIANNQVIKLRMTIKETSGLAGESNVKFYLQYSLASDFSSGVNTLAEIANCNSTSTWCYASGGGADNTVITTKVLSDADSCSASVGNGCGTHNTSGISTSTATQAAGAATEYEFTIKDSGATNGSVYFFRAVNSADGVAVPLNGTSTYPSLLPDSETLGFSVAGLPQGTSTNGIVTDVSSTATSIPFGTLPFGSSLKAAQRLTATTNASSGYEIYVLEDAPLTDTRGDTVRSLNATNASPLSWTTTCTSTSTGCYGYHAGSSVLSGGSTRFAANDTYAGFSTSTAEVGWNGAPASSSTMDMVYRVQANVTQNNGSYSSNIIYIIAPSFF